MNILDQTMDTCPVGEQQTFDVKSDGYNTITRYVNSFDHLSIFFNYSKWKSIAKCNGMDFNFDGFLFKNGFSHS